MQQIFKMLSQWNGLHSLLRRCSVLVYLLLLTHSCKGQSNVIGPSQPIAAKVGDDIILPCHVEPAADVVSFMLEWTRPDLNPVFVHVRRAGQDLIDTKHPSYKGRTSVSIDELKNGNVSLKLSKVKPSDAGRYECYIPNLNTGAFVELVVGAASIPFISISGLDRNKGGVVLQCESTGWYPEPEVFWLDGEGNLLSAGPTETVRGPDDLYTVSSRVTVEKRHSNSFTCRVQQNSTNQIREAQIHVPEDFFEVQSSSSSTTVILSVSLAVCILVILILGLYVWRLKKTKTKRSHRDESDEGEKNQESEVLMTKSKWPLVTRQKLKEEQQKLKGEQQSREEAENRVQILEEELQKKNRELQEEKKRREEAEEEVQRKNQELQDETDQIGNKDEIIKNLQQERQDKEKALKNQLESKNKESMEKLKEEKKTLQAKIREFEKQQTEVKQLKDDIQKMETDLQTLMEDLQSDTLEISPPSQAGRSWSGPVQYIYSLVGSYRTSQVQSGPVQSVPLLKWPEVLRQKFQEKLQKITEKQNSSSLSQNSTRKLAVVVKVDPWGRYIQLRNTSTQDQQLGGWDLKIQVNKEEPIIHTFEDSFNLKTGHVFTVGCFGYGGSVPRAHLVLENLKSWSHTDNLQVFLIRHPGEIQYNLDCVY